MQPVYIIHTSEIGLKGANRGFFEDALRDNIKRVAPGVRVQKIPAGFIVAGGGDKHDQNLLLALKRVFGAATILVAWEVGSLDLEKVAAAVLELLQKNCHCEPDEAISIQQGQIATPRSALLAMTKKEIKTFRIKVQRSDKTVSFNSLQAATQVGRAVQQATGWQVNLKKADCTIQLEFVNGRAFVGFERWWGAGGLPTGTSGRVLVLLSGGIDSPVAAWRMMRRGAICDFVHFHSYPQTDRRSIEKVKRLAAVLNRWQGSAGELLLQEFLPFQKQVLAKADMKYAVLLYRREMMRQANVVARARHCQALVSGDALGQVASQTLENMSVVSAASALPLFRPLIGFDKQEIMDEAKRIGTYDISIEPHEDCCSLFVPRHPKTKARLEEVEYEEKKLIIP